MQFACFEYSKKVAISLPLNSKFFRTVSIFNRENITIERRVRKRKLFDSAESRSRRGYVDVFVRALRADTVAVIRPYFVTFISNFITRIYAHNLLIGTLIVFVVVPPEYDKEKARGHYKKNCKKNKKCLLTDSNRRLPVDLTPNACTRISPTHPRDCYFLSVVVRVDVRVC